MARIRGSLTDVITLQEFDFQFEPRVREKNTTKFAKQNIIGQRLPSYSWVGGGESDVEVDIFLLGTAASIAAAGSSDLSALEKLQNFKNFLLAQEDTAAPHPVYINVGSIFTGHVYVMVHCDVEYMTYAYTDDMDPNEIKAKLKFEEIPG